MWYNTIKQIGVNKMNIIRTAAVELSEIPAIAYKQKLASRGSGVKILRLDQDAAAVFTLDKRSGLPIAYGKVDEELFPMSAVDEAVNLTEGLPYSSRGKIKVSVFEEIKDEEDVSDDNNSSIDMVNTDEYIAIIERYTDENGKMNYALMNKDFIQFASRSKVVSELLAQRALEEQILVQIIKNRAAHLADKREHISDEEAEALILTLDEIDTRGAFKELKNHIRRLLSRK